MPPLGILLLFFRADGARLGSAGRASLQKQVRFVFLYFDSFQLFDLLLLWWIGNRKSDFSLIVNNKKRKGGWNFVVVWWRWWDFVQRHPIMVCLFSGIVLRRYWIFNWKWMWRMLYCGDCWFLIFCIVFICAFTSKPKKLSESAAIKAAHYIIMAILSRHNIFDDLFNSNC